MYVCMCDYHNHIMCVRVCTHKYVCVCMHALMLACTDGWMDGWTDGRMDGWMLGWTDGWMDGWMYGCMYLYFLHQCMTDGRKEIMHACMYLCLLV